MICECCTFAWECFFLLRLFYVPYECVFSRKKIVKNRRIIQDRFFRFFSCWPWDVGDYSYVRLEKKKIILQEARRTQHCLWSWNIIVLSSYSSVAQGQGYRFLFMRSWHRISARETSLIVRAVSGPISYSSVLKIARKSNVERLLFHLFPQWNLNIDFF